MAACFAVAAGASTLLLAQSGCGGASVGGGIGGSGFVAGPIDELGSIVVEGIRFAIDDAEIVLNGEAASADDLALGMFVGVYGTFDEEEASGIATLVEFEESVSGTVTSASPDRKRIVVLGQSVSLDDSTRLAGISLNGLRPGAVVTVSGSRDADGSIVATFVAQRLPVRGCRVLGNVAELAPDGSSFRIGDLEVDASQATVVGGTLVDGDRVGVFAETCEHGALLVAREIRRLETTQPRPPGKLRSVRGFVVEAGGDDRFRMNVPGVGTVVVEVTTRTEFERGSAADVSRNDLLRVTGLVNEEAVLRAARIRFLRDSGTAKQRKDP